MIRIPLQWEYDVAERKGTARGLAAVDPARVIQVNLSSFSTPPDSLGIPRWISINTTQSTSVHDVVTEIHSRLGKLEYPFTIFTIGAEPRELHLDSAAAIQDYLPVYDATSLSLRLNVHMPDAPKQQKKSFGSKLRGAFGSGSSRPAESQDGSAAGASRLSVASAPPPYEEAVRPA